MGMNSFEEMYASQTWTVLYFSVSEIARREVELHQKDVVTYGLCCECCWLWSTWRGT